MPSSVHALNDRDHAAAAHPRSGRIPDKVTQPGSLVAKIRSAQRLRRPITRPYRFRPHPPSYLQDCDQLGRNPISFARDEVETMISDARIPADRQMVHALEFLAGVRPGKPLRCAGGTTILPERTGEHPARRRHRRARCRPRRPRGEGAGNRVPGGLPRRTRFRGIAGPAIIGIRGGPGAPVSEPAKPTRRSSSTSRAGRGFDRDLRSPHRRPSTVARCPTIVP